ncbi:MAG: TolC family protein [candidate division WOR-3 bacterium]
MTNCPFFLLFWLSLFSPSDTVKLSLSSAINFAFRKSPYRWQEKYHQRAVYQRVLEPIERILPSPFFNLGYSKWETERVGIERRGKSYQGEIGLIQPLFSIDLFLGLAGIGYGTRLEKANLRWSRAKLKYLTTSAYYNLLKAQEVYRIKREEVLKRESLFSFSKEMFRLNKSGRIDLLRSENELYQARLEESSAQKDLLFAQENLKRIIGWEGNQFFWATEELTPPDSFTLDFSHFWENLLRKNPELKVATEGRNWARLSYYSSLFAFLPSLSLTLSSRYSDSLSFPKGIKEWQTEDELSLSLSLTFPFLDLPNYSLSQLAKSQEKNRQEGQWKETWLSLYQSAHNAYLSLKLAFSRYLSAKKNLELAEEMFRLAEEERRLGRLSYLDFLDITTKYETAHQIYISSIVEIREAEAEMEYLLGGEE